MLLRFGKAELIVLERLVKLSASFALFIKKYLSQELTAVFLADFLLNCTAIKTPPSLPIFIVSIGE